MNLNPIVLSIPIYFLLIGIELIIEKWQHRKLYRFNDAVTNISCGITSQVSGVFMKVLVIGIYELIYSNLRFFTIPNSWIAYIILFIAVDFFYYWAHRMSHEINLFWGGHVVHHQSEDYNFSVALRQGSFQGLFTFSFNLPLAFLGFDTATFIVVSALVTVYQFWIHTELIGKMGFLEWFMNTPSHHRVHHGRDPKYIDKNHAGVFIVWDRLFGTFQVEEEKPTYGITTPMASWNPIWSNLRHYSDMWQLLKLTSKWQDKVKVMFKKPGWRPEYLGGYMAAPEVDKSTYKKYTTASPVSLSYYVLFQYVLVLGGTAYFLFNEKTFTMGMKSIVCFFILFAVFNLGAIFERKSWIWLPELLRIVATGVFIIYLTGASLSDISSLLALAFIVASSAWLFYFKNELEPEKMISV